METVCQRMKTLPRPKCYEWKSVQGCAVMGSDMLWYRGEVVEVLGEYVKVSTTSSHPSPCCSIVKHLYAF